MVAATPVPLDTSATEETLAPTDGDLELIRSELDPNRWYTR